MSTRDVIDTLTSAGRRSHYERLGQLITDLTVRCDREGLDIAVRREADSRGAWHIVIVTSWQSGETVHFEGDTLTEVLDMVLDELNRRVMI